MTEPIRIPPLPVEFQDLARTQIAIQEELLQVPSIVGVALGNKRVNGVDTGERAIVVLVESKAVADALPVDEIVPPQIDGIPTDVQEVGQLWAGLPPIVEPAAVTLTRRVRPAFGGVSVGHVNITAGTIATGCYDSTAFPGMPGKFYLLSNNHVLANSNAASPGDAILQPGPFDGGKPETDTIGRLDRFIQIRFHDGSASPPTNEVDAALAEIDLSEMDRSVHWVGTLRRSILTPQVGRLLCKCGRSTGLTTGSIVNINATVDVNYGVGQVARFTGQLVTSAMSAPGDSGSLICDLEGAAVGLLFAGSNVATIVNPIEAVQRLLGVKVTDG